MKKKTVKYSATQKVKPHDEWAADGKDTAVMIIPLMIFFLAIVIGVIWWVTR